VVSSYVNGVELNQVSVQDSNRYADSGVNWRVAEGYGSVIAAQAIGLPIRLNCPVMLIDHRGKRLSIETALGTVMADAVIVTVPTPLIAAQGIRFRPELTDKVDAASVLPLGLADKLVMAVEAPELLPVDGHLIGNSNRTATGSYHLRPSAGLLSKDFSVGGFNAHLVWHGAPSCPGSRSPCCFCRLAGRRCCACHLHFAIFQRAFRALSPSRAAVAFKIARPPRRRFCVVPKPL
jgi:monoamine oxidase